MTFLLFSDSHGSLGAMKTAAEEEPHDRILFLGDTERDIDDFQNAHPNEAVCKVAGNNDFTWRQDALEKTLTAGAYKILCCHGHRYHVKTSYDALRHAAREKNCRIALFGHTHRQFAEDRDGVLLLNPGSAGYRGEYAVLIINGQTIEYKLKRAAK